VDAALGRCRHAPVLWGTHAGLSFDLSAFSCLSAWRWARSMCCFCDRSFADLRLLTVSFAHGAFYRSAPIRDQTILIAGRNFWICLIAVPLASPVRSPRSSCILIRGRSRPRIVLPLLLTSAQLLEWSNGCASPSARPDLPFDLPEMRKVAGIRVVIFASTWVCDSARRVVLLRSWPVSGKDHVVLIIRAGRAIPAFVRVLASMWPCWSAALFGSGPRSRALPDCLAPASSASPDMGRDQPRRGLFVNVVGRMGSSAVRYLPVFCRRRSSA